MRYSSFALASGHPASIILPMFVAFTNVSSMTAKQIDSQKERYGDQFIEVSLCTANEGSNSALAEKNYVLHSPMHTLFECTAIEMSQL